MSGNLQVTDIQATNVGIEIKVAGVPKILKIASHGQILIRHEVITTEELKIGDEILAYGFDIVPKSFPEKKIEITPSKQYNKIERRRKCVRIPVITKEIKHGKRYDATSGSKTHSTKVEGRR